MIPIVSVSLALLFLIKLRCGASVNTINKIKNCCTLNSKINVTPKGDYWPISWLATLYFSRNEFTSP